MDKFSKEKRSDIMSYIRSKNTKLEEVVRKYLFQKVLDIEKMIRDILESQIFCCQSTAQQFLLTVVFGINIPATLLQYCRKLIKIIGMKSFKKRRT